MLNSLTRRQIERHARELQELIRTVPGNGVCADCAAKAPGWASWNLGVFLCLQCATVHRKLGTHISRVKSLTMDSWTSEQVESMRRHGNSASNRTLNPAGTLPDWTKGDAAQSMERFIFRKYSDRAFARPVSASTKPSVRPDSPASQTRPGLASSIPARMALGPRSASASFPASATARSSTPPTTGKRRPAVPEQRFGLTIGTDSGLKTKLSRVFGDNVSALDDKLEPKLAALRQMGFADDARNTAVLREFNGHLQKAVEFLMRSDDETLPTVPMATGSSTSTSASSSATSATNSANPFHQPTVTTTNPFLMTGPRAQSVGPSLAMYGPHTFTPPPQTPFTPQSSFTSNPFLSSSPAGMSMPMSMSMQMPMSTPTGFAGGMPMNMGMPMATGFPHAAYGFSPAHSAAGSAATTPLGYMAGGPGMGAMSTPQQQAGYFTPQLTSQPFYGPTSAAGPDHALKASIMALYGSPGVGAAGKKVLSRNPFAPGEVTVSGLP